MHSDPNAPVTHAQLNESLEALEKRVETHLENRLTSALAAQEERMTRSLAAQEERMTRSLAAQEERMTRSLAGEIARAADVVIEHLTARFRVGDDRTTAVSDRLDAHIADAGVHRAPRRR